jgi:hypothetical protein
LALTVAQVETELLIDLGPYLDRVGLDGTTNDGTNVHLRGSIRRAIRRLGHTTADPITVSDADLSGIEGSAVDALLDLAKLYAFQVCWGNWPHVNFKAGENSQDLSDLADRLQEEIAKLKDETDETLPPEELTAAPPSAFGVIETGRYQPGRPGYPHRLFRYLDS